MKELKRILGQEFINRLKYFPIIGKNSRAISYSQSGEDLIIDFIFKNIFKQGKINYLDIGAHHPHYLSNTYKFYKDGSSGVCVEPDPYLYKKIKNKRKRDICLNVGVGFEDSQSAMMFYLMSPSTLNTFSAQEAEKYEKKFGHKILNTINVELKTINSIVKNYFDNKVDLVSIDVEGLDYKIIESFDFSKCRPKVFCIETSEYVTGKIPCKNEDILTIMKNNHYKIYSDTFINTIFIDAQEWETSLKNDKGK